MSSDNHNNLSKKPGCRPAVASRIFRPALPVTNSVRDGRHRQTAAVSIKAKRTHSNPLGRNRPPWGLSRAADCLRPYSFPVVTATELCTRRLRRRDHRLAARWCPQGRNPGSGQYRHRWPNSLSLPNIPSCLFYKHLHLLPRPVTNSVLSGRVGDQLGAKRQSVGVTCLQLLPLGGKNTLY